MEFIRENVLDCLNTEKAIEVNGFTAPMLTWTKKGETCAVQVKRHCFYSEGYGWCNYVRIWESHVLYKELFSLVSLIEKESKKIFCKNEKHEDIKIKERENAIDRIYEIFGDDLFHKGITYAHIENKAVVLGADYQHAYDEEYVNSKMHEGVFQDALNILEFAEGLNK